MIMVSLNVNVIMCISPHTGQLPTCKKDEYGFQKRLDISNTCKMKTITAMILPTLVK